jgi:DNA-binding IclR family transcriptional regulator
MVIPLLGSATGKVFAAFSAPELTNPYIEAELAAADDVNGIRYAHGF